MSAPLLAPPEAQPAASTPDDPTLAFDGAPPTERLAKPFRLGVVGLGAALGLFGRLAAANGFGELNSSPLLLTAAATSAIVGLGLCMIAAERDRFGPPLGWITIIAALAWGTLNWISPPFESSVTVWSKPDQTVLAVVGFGNGLLLAGLIALAFVRRAPTLSVATALLAGVAVLAANSVLLRNEWPAIVAIGLAFTLVLLAWDRSPRREHRYVVPSDSPRVSRAALSFIAVAFCGTALQLWISRTSIPRSIPAVALCVVLIGAAFASLIRVRREIERRETTLSEWTSWMREIRTNDFRAQMQNFDSQTGSATVGSDGEAPRKLSFPNLTVPDDRPPILPEPTPTGFGTADLAAAAADLGVIEAPSEGAPAIVVPTADEPLWSSGPDDAAADAALSTEPLPDAPTPAVPPAASAPEPTRPAPAHTFGDLLPTADTAPMPSTPAGATQHAAVGAPEPIEQAATNEDRSGAFSSVLASASQAPDPITVQLGDLDALSRWLDAPRAGTGPPPLIVAIEAMSLDEFDSLPPEDAAMATSEIGAFLADAMPSADLVAWMDGPYFIVAHASKPNSELLELNNRLRKLLKSTDGMLALLRPGPDATLNDIVDESVMGLLQARQLQQG